MEKTFEIRCRGVILDKGELLVVRHTNKQAYLVLPGGHLEWGEDVKAGLSRELEEELGVAPIIGPLLYIHNFNKDETVATIEFLFRVENGYDYRIIGENRTHAHELASIEWVSPSSELISIRPQGVAYDFLEGRLGDGQLRYLIDGVPATD